MWPTLKKELFIIGLLVALVGALPFLKDVAALAPYLANIPTEGIIYQAIIIFLGLVAMLLGKPTRTY